MFQRFARRRAEEERADMLFVRERPTKRASEASTSHSGELWDEVGGF
jgi:hypothetical protein